MKTPSLTIYSRTSRRAAVELAVGALACTVLLSATVASTSASAVPSRARGAHVHDACSGPNSSKVPCHFSTPSGNIRCLWTPTPNNVECELLSSRRAFRLRPTGKAKAIKLRLKRRGQTLPRSQEIVFPQSLSCRDTNTTMTCNQDFGLGGFKLAPHGSRGF